MGELIRFESRRVGKIEVSESEVVRFEPLPGFPNRSRFVIMEHAEASELAWLVSIEDPDLAFVVASPAPGLFEVAIAEVMRQRGQMFYGAGQSIIAHDILP